MAAPKNNLIENKPKASLIPIDLLMEFLCPAYDEGLIKYFQDSWREGFETTIMADALLRHYSAYMNKKEDYDPDTLEKYGIKKHHLGAMLFCVLCLCDTYSNHPEMDDRHKDWKKEKKENLNQFNLIKVPPCPCIFKNFPDFIPDYVSSQDKNIEQKLSPLYGQLVFIFRNNIWQWDGPFTLKENYFKPPYFAVAGHFTEYICTCPPTYEERALNDKL